WDLVWAGIVTNDTLAPVRAGLAGGTAARHAAAVPRTRYTGRPPRPGRAGSFGFAVGSRPVPADAAGRWCLVPEREADATRRALAWAGVPRARQGVVTRGAVAAEDLQGGFGAAYRVLSQFEESGRCRRGYFVESLGAAQFAAPGAVDRLRDEARRAE